MGLFSRGGRDKKRHVSLAAALNPQAPVTVVDVQRVDDLRHLRPAEARLFARIATLRFTAVLGRDVTVLGMLYECHVKMNMRPIPWIGIAIVDVGNGEFAGLTYDGHAGQAEHSTGKNPRNPAWIREWSFDRPDPLHGALLRLSEVEQVAGLTRDAYDAFVDAVRLERPRPPSRQPPRPPSAATRARVAEYEEIARIASRFVSWDTADAELRHGDISEDEGKLGQWREEGPGFRRIFDRRWENLDLELRWPPAYGHRLD